MLSKLDSATFRTWEQNKPKGDKFLILKNSIEFLNSHSEIFQTMKVEGKGSYRRARLKG